MSLQHIFKNSSVSGKEPTASQLANGELSINYHADGPFLCCKDTAGVVRRIAGVWVAATPPGTPTAGELWMDTSLNPTQLKIYKDGVDGWVFAGNVVNASTTTAGVVELSTDAETQAGGSTVVAVTPASLQSKLSDSTSTSSSTTIASSSAVKAAYDLAATAISTSGGTITGTLEIGDTGSLTFEGSSVDAYETLLDVVDPTADRTITLPDVSGTVITTGDTGTVTSTMLADGTIVDADINASAAIAGTKISPNFGDQDITIGDKIIHNGDTDTAIRFPAADTVAIETAGSERLRVTSDGKLGLGTSAPATALSNSSALASDGTQSAGSNSLNWRASNTNAYIAAIENLTTGNGLLVKVGDSDPARNVIHALDASNNSLFLVQGDGNVGVGTTSPSEALNVSGNILATGRVRSKSGTTGDVGLGFEDDHNVGLYRPSADILGFVTTSTERARIDSSGRLLVGTSTNVQVPLSSSTLGAPGKQLADVSQGGATSAQYAYSTIPTVAPNLVLARSRGALNAQGLVSDGDSLGRIVFEGSDGQTVGTNSGFIRAAVIEAQVDGTASAGDMPGRLVFSTTADGASSPTERMRIDSSGRLLVGTSSSLSVNSINASVQILNTATNNGASLTIGRFNNDTSGPQLILGKSRNATIAAGTIVQNGDDLGQLVFNGDDGTDLNNGAARIQAFVDGTPGANDMPGRLVFSTTTDGSASPTEAMRINSTQELLVGYTSDNGAYKLQVNSQIFATSATIATSDGRYKDNVTTLDGCADLIRSLRPVSFDWKPQQNITRLDEDGNETLVREGHNFPAGTQVGFIAQEVQDVLTGKPWLGSIIKENVRPAITDADGTELAPEEQFYGIAEGNLIAVLTSALKDTLSEIDALKARVAALEAP